MDVRTAESADLDGLTAVLTAAFRDDPVWRWALPDPGALEAFWRFLIGSALRYPCVWIAGDYEAASVWIPPGGVELAPEEEERLEPLLRDLAGARAPDLLEMLARFEEAHPRDTPHYYLSLLGVHPEHRGHGLGMALVADNLRLIDAERAPAYLESTNPANIRRYQNAGFQPLGDFTTPGGEHTLTTMWRAARA